MTNARLWELFSPFFQIHWKHSWCSPPDLLIYLKASIGTLVDQIQKRGREYEENIRLDYLKRLNEYYNKWIESYTDGPLLIIEVDQLDFAEKEEDLAVVIRKIEGQLNGLF